MKTEVAAPAALPIHEYYPNPLYTPHAGAEARAALARTLKRAIPIGFVSSLALCFLFPLVLRDELVPWSEGAGGLGMLISSMLLGALFGNHMNRQMDKIHERVQSTLRADFILQGLPLSEDLTREQVAAAVELQHELSRLIATSEEAEWGEGELSPEQQLAHDRFLERSTELRSQILAILQSAPSALR